MSRPCRLAHWRSQPHPLQGDSTQQHVKSLDVVLGAEMAVLIVDDTAGVWPQHSRNLLQVTTPWSSMPECLALAALGTRGAACGWCHENVRAASSGD